MAVNTRRIFPLQQAKERRGSVSRYLELDGSRYLLGAIILLCLVSLIALAQTGVVATKGYEISQLEQERVQLLRERSQLQMRLAAAQSLHEVQRRALVLGLKPMTEDQAIYMIVPDTIMNSPLSLSQSVPADDTSAESLIDSNEDLP
jgi:hypothetical protein